MVFPASEVLCEKERLIGLINDYLAGQKKLTDKQKNQILADISALKEGRSFPLDRYIRLIYKDSTVFDYVKGAVVVTSELVSVK